MASGVLRYYGACMAYLLVVYIVCQAAFVSASSSDGFSGEVRFVSSSDEYDSELTWHTPSDAVVPVSNNNALRICDCEYASTSYHGGLLCNKEGYFITNFQAVGHWINGGGRVPLSKAKCCRLCVPDTLTSEQKQALPDGTNITGVISVGCHASTAKSKVSCESDPTTTVAIGFQKAILVPSLASATFYPEGPMTCCVPALMLSNGDAWEIERCNCEWSKSTGCESISSDHLLWGYGEFREGGAGAHVPIAPAQCCRACVGDQVHSMEKCRSLNHCSRRGVCVLGQCACDEGWGGADCSHALSEPSWPPAWIVYTAVAASTIVSMVLWLASRQLLSDYIERRRQAQDENAAMLDPLMIADGEIGDEDSTDDEAYYTDDTPTEAAAQPVVPAPVSTPPATPSSATVQARAGAAAEDIETASLLATTAETAQSDAQLRSASDAPVEATIDGDKAAASTSAAAAVDLEAEAEAEAKRLAEEEQEAARIAELEREYDEKTSPLQHVKCKICFERPVQVTLVPCGHSNLCRHCSRRLEHCPFCRKPIIRRQRLYLADT